MDCKVHRVTKSWTLLSDFHFASLEVSSSHTEGLWVAGQLQWGTAGGWPTARVDERTPEAKTSLSAPFPRSPCERAQGVTPGVEKHRCQQHNRIFICSFSSSALCLSFSGQNGRNALTLWDYLAKERLVRS